MPVVTERLVNRPVWFDLSTSVLSAAIALYAEPFGWTFGDSAAELGFYTMAVATGIPAAAVAPNMPRQDAAPVTWTVYFGVTDADPLGKGSHPIGCPTSPWTRSTPQMPRCVSMAARS